MNELVKSPLLSSLAFKRDAIEHTIPWRFEEVVRACPEKVALAGGGRYWTYRDLNREANRIAHAIRGNTPKEIGCVAFLVEQSPEMVIATLGVLKAGKIYLGLHPAVPATANREIVRDAEPQLVLATAALAGRAREIAGDSCKVLVLEEIPQESERGVEWPSARPQDPSSIFYTSGTTGRPKGVVKSHRAVLHRVWLSTQHDHIVPEDRQSLLTHCSFSASESDMFGALLQGATVCVFDLASADLSSFRDWINREKITLLHPPVLLFRNFLSTLTGTNLFPTVRLVALAGDVVLPSDIQMWARHFSPSCTLLHRYSIAETALLTVGRVVAGAAAGCASVPDGHVVADKSVTVDESGEIVVRSRYLADGYWRHPEETAERFAPDGSGETTFRTGDMGKFEADGSLKFLGRREHLAKIRGFRVDTREVEAALLELEEVSAAAVVIHRENDEDRLWAFLVVKHFDERALRTKLRDRLPDWKIPARFEALASLPVTLSGKVDRQALLRTVPEPKVSPSSQGGLEEELADIWRVTLRVENPGWDDQFVDLGGDSISAMMTLNWVERIYGIRLTQAQFFQNATIRGLAGLIKTQPGVQKKLAEPDSVADAFLRMLDQQGVEYVFVNPGSDIAPILESAAKFKANGTPAPELILCLHESVAMAAAHGYFMVTGRPQVVMVHVDVGTLNLGANLHNAQRGRAGVVICTGKTPYTFQGGPGGRNHANHWAQDQFDQSGIVAGYVKWRYELTQAENLPFAVARAFQMSGSEPAGPVYLTLPREVLMQRYAGERAGSPAKTSPQYPSPDSLAQAARWLLDAERPLILVAHSGRNPDAVPALVELAEIAGAPVVEARARMNFPASHPLHLGFSSQRYLQEADCVLIIDRDVPWIPEQSNGPGPGARVIQIDIDPLKNDFPMWGFTVDLAIQADSALACTALAAELRRRMKAEDRGRIEARRARLQAEHEEQRTRSLGRAFERSTQKPIAPEWAAFCLNEIVDGDTVVVAEAVTNNPMLWNYLQQDTPGSYYQSQGSGLGWGLGAALGAKLGDRSKTVICVSGDGSWLFSNPIAAYWAGEQHGCPFLTVLFNNEEYFATAKGILSAAPNGYARQAGDYPACDLPKSPMHTRIAEAMGLWTKSVEDPAELQAALKEALAQVRSGHSALVDIRVSSPRPDEIAAEE